MILVTTETVYGKNCQPMGVVSGSTIQTKHMFSDIGQSFKNMVGGELKSYNDMMIKARELATARMMEQAAAMGADAVVCVRYSTASITQGAAEVFAYGTAVKFV